MKLKPIRTFKSNDEYIKVAFFLKDLLFLEDWSIVFQLSDKPIKTDNNVYASGLCVFDYGNRQAIITVLNSNDWSSCEDSKPLFGSNCALLNLIHEMLHLKKEYINEEDLGNENDKSSFMDKVDKHADMEKMAKTIFMALTGEDELFFLK